MDDTCIKNVLNGDKEAFRKIITKYKDMAYSIAMSVVKNEFHSAEIVQVSFLIAYNKLDTFKGGSKFSTWLYRIVINESFKFIKKQKTEIVDFVENLPDYTSESDSSILKLEEDEQKDLINEALGKIPSKESLVLRLFYLEENSIDEIRDLTGWSISNIKVLLHRARINLKSVLISSYRINK